MNCLSNENVFCHRWKSSYVTDLYGVLEPCVEFHLDAPVFPQSVQDHPQEHLPQTLQNPGVHNNQKDHAHGHSDLLHMQSITTLQSPIYLENMLPRINLCVITFIITVCPLYH